MKKLLPEENLFLQVFLNDGTNYLEDKAITNHIIGQNVKLNIPIEFTQYVSEIRLDPLNVSCVLQNLKVQIVTKDNNEYEIEHYRHNAIITKDHDFIFASEDPQIIFENQWENNVREVKIAFRIREAGLQDNPILSALSELKCHMNKVENELEYMKMLYDESNRRSMFADDYFREEVVLYPHMDSGRRGGLYLQAVPVALK